MSTQETAGVVPMYTACWATGNVHPGRARGVQMTFWKERGKGGVMPPKCLRAT